MSLHPQCLQTRASLSTSSRQSGHRTCVSGVGAPGAPRRFGSRTTANRAIRLNSRPSTNQPAALRPRVLAAIAVSTATANQRYPNSMLIPPGWTLALGPKADRCTAEESLMTAWLSRLVDTKSGNLAQIGRTLLSQNRRFVEACVVGRLRSRRCQQCRRSTTESIFKWSRRSSDPVRSTTAIGYPSVIWRR